MANMPCAYPPGTGGWGNPNPTIPGMKSARLPRLRNEPLARPRLLNTLQQARALRCISLVAPAGAGKTALLQSWARKARTGHATMVWLRPEQGRLSAALASQSALLGEPLARALRQRLPPGEKEALEAIAIAIVGHGALTPRQLVFVFDQLQDLDDPAALLGLQPLLDYCPPRVQCIFASRDPLSLSLGRLREHSELLELGAQDLCWTSDEAHVLVRSILGEAGLPHTTGWLVQTDGWSLGLASICHAVRAGRHAGDLWREAFDFLDTQVLPAVPEAYAAPLVRMSAAEVFDAPLAGISETELEQLAARTGFLQRVDNSRWWRFHAMLGHLLRRRFEALDAAARRRAHRRASAHFAETDQKRLAVRHAVLGGDTRRAADLVEGWAGLLFQQGDHDRLAELVRLIPDPVAARHPRLRLWTALLALVEHRYDECRTILGALARQVDPADLATQRRVRVLQGWLAVFRDDMASAEALFPAGQAAGQDSGVDDITLAGERNVLSWIHIYRNEYQRARDVQETTAAAPRGTLFGSLSGRCLSGLSLALEGRMANAERIYREVLQQANGNGAACIDPAVLATGLLGETLYELNDLTGVLALQPQLGQLRQRSLPDPFLRVVLVMLRTHAVLGRLDEAMDHAALLEAYARERGLDRLLSYALLERIHLSLLRHDPDAARPAWDELARLRKPHDTAESTVLGEVTMVVDRAEILLLLYRGRLGPARAQVDKLLELSARRGRRRRVAALHFQRAAIDLELGDMPSAAHHALQGLTLGARLGLVRSLVDAHPAVARLLDIAMESPGHDARLVFHADRLRAAAGVGPLVALQLGAAPPAGGPAWRRPGPAISLSGREEQVAELLALALPNKEIARVLGLSPETVKWHLHNLYAKLGVATRYGAVTALRERSQGK